jgi:hypothetical protein
MSMGTSCPTSASRVFMGPGTSCGPATNRLDCCPANFDRANGIDLQDILDFCGAWFGSNLAADFDHNGRLALNDFIGFVSAWVAGCH